MRQRMLAERERSKAKEEWQEIHTSGAKHYHDSQKAWRLQADMSLKE